MDLWTLAAVDGHVAGEILTGVEDWVRRAGGTFLMACVSPAPPAKQVSYVSGPYGPIRVHMGPYGPHMGP